MRASKFPSLPVVGEFKKRQFKRGLTCYVEVGSHALELPDKYMNETVYLKLLSLYFYF